MIPYLQGIGRSHLIHVGVLALLFSFLTGCVPPATQSFTIQSIAFGCAISGVAAKSLDQDAIKNVCAQTTATSKNGFVASCIALDQQGNMYLAGSSQLREFDTRGKEIRNWRLAQAAPGDAGTPSLMVVSSVGDVYVLQRGRRCNVLQIYDSKGSLRRSLNIRIEHRVLGFPSRDVPEVYFIAVTDRDSVMVGGMWSRSGKHVQDNCMEWVREYDASGKVRWDCRPSGKRFQGAIVSIANLNLPKPERMQTRYNYNYSISNSTGVKWDGPENDGAGKPYIAASYYITDEGWLVARQ